MSNTTSKSRRRSKRGRKSEDNGVIISEVDADTVPQPGKVQFNVYVKTTGGNERITSSSRRSSAPSSSGQTYANRAATQKRSRAKSVGQKGNNNNRNNVNSNCHKNNCRNNQKHNTVETIFYVTSKGKAKKTSIKTRKNSDTNTQNQEVFSPTKTVEIERKSSLTEPSTVLISKGQTSHAKHPSLTHEARRKSSNKVNKDSKKNSSTSVVRVNNFTPSSTGDNARRKSQETVIINVPCQGTLRQKVFTQEAAISLDAGDKELATQGVFLQGGKPTHHNDVVLHRGQYYDMIAVGNNQNKHGKRKRSKKRSGGSRDEVLCKKAAIASDGTRDSSATCRDQLEGSTVNTLFDETNVFKSGAMITDSQTKKNAECKESNESDNNEETHESDEYQEKTMNKTNFIVNETTTIESEDTANSSREAAYIHQTLDHNDQSEAGRVDRLLDRLSKKAVQPVEESDSEEIDETIALWFYELIEDAKDTLGLDEKISPNDIDDLIPNKGVEDEVDSENAVVGGKYLLNEYIENERECLIDSECNTENRVVNSTAAPSESKEHKDRASSIVETDESKNCDKAFAKKPENGFMFPTNHGEIIPQHMDKIGLVKCNPDDESIHAVKALDEDETDSEQRAHSTHKDDLSVAQTGKLTDKEDILGGEGPPSDTTEIDFKQLNHVLSTDQDGSIATDPITGTNKKLVEEISDEGIIGPIDNNDDTKTVDPINQNTETRKQFDDSNDSIDHPVSVTAPPEESDTTASNDPTNGATAKENVGNTESRNPEETDIDKENDRENSHGEPDNDAIGRDLINQSMNDSHVAKSGDMDDSIEKMMNLMSQLKKEVKEIDDSIIEGKGDKMINVSSPQIVRYIVELVVEKEEGIGDDCIQDSKRKIAIAADANRFDPADNLVNDRGMIVRLEHNRFAHEEVNETESIARVEETLTDEATKDNIPEIKDNRDTGEWIVPEEESASTMEKHLELEEIPSDESSKDSLSEIMKNHDTAQVLVPEEQLITTTENILEVEETPAEESTEDSTPGNIKDMITAEELMLNVDSVTKSEKSLENAETSVDESTEYNIPEIGESQNTAESTTKVYTTEITLEIEGTLADKSTQHTITETLDDQNTPETFLPKQQLVNTTNNIMEFADPPNDKSTEDRKPKIIGDPNTTEEYLEVETTDETTNDRFPEILHNQNTEADDATKVSIPEIMDDQNTAKVLVPEQQLVTYTEKIVEMAIIKADGLPKNSGTSVLLVPTMSVPKELTKPKDNMKVEGTKADHTKEHVISDIMEDQYTAESLVPEEQLINATEIIVEVAETLAEELTEDRMSEIMDDQHTPEAFITEQQYVSITENILNVAGTLADETIKEYLPEIIDNHNAAKVMVLDDKLMNLTENIVELSKSLANQAMEESIPKALSDQNTVEEPLPEEELLIEFKVDPEFETISADDTRDDCIPEIIESQNKEVDERTKDTIPENKDDRNASEPLIPEEQLVTTTDNIKEVAETPADGPPDDCVPEIKDNHIALGANVPEEELVPTIENTGNIEETTDDETTEEIMHDIVEDQYTAEALVRADQSVTTTENLIEIEGTLAVKSTGNSIPKAMDDQITPEALVLEDQPITTAENIWKASKTLADEATEETIYEMTENQNTPDALSPQEKSVTTTENIIEVKEALADKSIEDITPKIMGNQNTPIALVPENQLVTTTEKFIEIEERLADISIRDSIPRAMDDQITPEALVPEDQLITTAENILQASETHADEATDESIQEMTENQKTPNALVPEKQLVTTTENFIEVQETQADKSTGDRIPQIMGDQNSPEASVLETPADETLEDVIHDTKGDPFIAEFLVLEEQSVTENIMEVEETQADESTEDIIPEMMGDKNTPEVLVPEEKSVTTTENIFEVAETLVDERNKNRVSEITHLCKNEKSSVVRGEEILELGKTSFGEETEENISLEMDGHASDESKQTEDSSSSTNDEFDEEIGYTPQSRIEEEDTNKLLNLTLTSKKIAELPIDEPTENTISGNEGSVISVTGMVENEQLSNPEIPMKSSDDHFENMLMKIENLEKEIRAATQDDIEVIKKKELTASSTSGSHTKNEISEHRKHEGTRKEIRRAKEKNVVQKELRFVGHRLMRAPSAQRYDVTIVETIMEKMNITGKEKTTKTKIILSNDVHLIQSECEESTILETVIKGVKTVPKKEASDSDVLTEKERQMGEAIVSGDENTEVIGLETDDKEVTKIEKEKITESGNSEAVITQTKIEENASVKSINEDVEDKDKEVIKTEREKKEFIDPRMESVPKTDSGESEVIKPRIEDLKVIETETEKEEFIMPSKEAATEADTSGKKVIEQRNGDVVVAETEGNEEELIRMSKENRQFTEAIAGEEKVIETRNKGVSRRGETEEELVIETRNADIEIIETETAKKGDIEHRYEDTKVTETRVQEEDLIQPRNEIVEVVEVSTEEKQVIELSSEDVENLEAETGEENVIEKGNNDLMDKGETENELVTESRNGDAEDVEDTKIETQVDEVVRKRTEESNVTVKGDKDEKITETERKESDIMKPSNKDRQFTETQVGKEKVIGGGNHDEAVTKSATEKEAVIETGNETIEGKERKGEEINIIEIRNTDVIVIEMKAEEKQTVEPKNKDVAAAPRNGDAGHNKTETVKKKVAEPRDEDVRVFEPKANKQKIIKQRNENPEVDASAKVIIAGEKRDDRGLSTSVQERRQMQLTGAVSDYGVNTVAINQVQTIRTDLDIVDREVDLEEPFPRIKTYIVKTLDAKETVILDNPQDIIPNFDQQTFSQNLDRTLIVTRYDRSNDSAITEQNNCIINMGSFSGNPVQFQKFWDTFYATVHNNPSLNNKEKLIWLRNHLRGPALSAISSLPITCESYNVALGRLWNRFGMRQRLLMLNINKLLSLPRVTSVNDKEKLQDIYHKIKKYTRNLNALQLNRVLISSILSKLPGPIRMKLLCTMPKDENWDVTTFLENLSRILQLRNEDDRKFGSECPTKTFGCHSQLKEENMHKNSHIQVQRGAKQRHAESLPTLPSSQFISTKGVDMRAKELALRASIRTCGSLSTKSCLKVSSRYDLSKANIELKKGRMDHSITFSLWNDARGVY